MIVRAWGTWELFQTLLKVLRRIGDRHGNLSIANVATRWVLDHPFVGAVLIGKFHLLSFHSTRTHVWALLFVGGTTANVILITISLWLTFTHTYIMDSILIFTSDAELPGLYHPGARLGLSEHPDDNQNAFGFHLSQQDGDEIEAVLQHSNSRRMITTIGDCGAEYRQL